MGNIQTKNQLPDKKNFHILDYGYCKVWKRKLDQKEIMEEYPVYIQSEERLKIFQNVWPLRTNHPIFVNVYHFAHSQQGNFCTSTARGYLFTQRIPYRLSEFGNIKYPQIVKIMKICIEGYKIFYENFGVFMIRSTMIGFTQDFKVKVWFHTDFSEPQPQNPNCKGLQEMFISLINAVQSTCEYLYYNCPRFSQFIVQTNYVYFSKDFDFLMKGLDDYVKKLGIKIPVELKHLKSYLKKPEGWEKFKAKNNYPKILISQTQIPQDSTTVHQITQKKIQIPIKPKKQVQLPPPQLKKSFSNHTLKTGTNDRINLRNMQPDPYSIQIPNQKTKPFFSPNNIKVQNNQQKEQLNLWKNSQNFVTDRPKNPQNLYRVSTQTNEPNRQSQKISFNNPSNQYFGEMTSNSKNYSSKRSSLTKNEYFPRKSFDLSTDTRNRDKSFESQLSLIEDLQTKAKKNLLNQNFKFK